MTVAEYQAMMEGHDKANATANMTCSDGLNLTAINTTDCPPSKTAVLLLKNCSMALPGKLCHGDLTCGLNPDLNNCGQFDIYRKQEEPLIVSTLSSDVAAGATSLDI